MRLRRFMQIDVFTTTPYAGNALAVVLDGDGLTTTQMQRFANWMNLSETTFLLPPTTDAADYRVRIFTRPSSCPSPVIRRSARATPGDPPARLRSMPIASVPRSAGTVEREKRDAPDAKVTTALSRQRVARRAR